MYKNKYRFVFLAAIFGNILEYFDYTLYTIFVLQLGQAFFPKSSEFVQVISALSLFAVGFLARPIGGIFFGYIGDKYGRKTSLVISMLGMTIPTFIIGLIPTFSQIGYLAPLALALLRLMQGLCLSGEGAGTAIFVLEHQHNLKPGLVTGLVHGSNTAGMLLAALVGIIVENYYSDIADAWRIAFLLGGILGLIGLYIRVKVAETPVFLELVKKRNILKYPLIHVIKTAKHKMLITFCVGGVTSSIVYLVKSVNVFYKTILHFNNSSALYYLFYTSCILMICMPISGAISDFYGRTKVMICSVAATVIAAVVVFFLMSSDIMWHQLLGLTGLGILAGGVSGVSYIFIISLFTPEQRFTGIAFSFNLGNAIFGGTAPTITTWLAGTIKHNYGPTLGHIAPAFYIMTTSTIFLLIMYFTYHWIKEYDNQQNFSNKH